GHKNLTAYTPVVVAIARRDVGDRQTGTLHVGVKLEHVAVIENHRGYFLGVAILQPELQYQLQFVVADDRVGLNHRMRKGAHIVDKTGGDQFARFSASSYVAVLLHYTNLEAGLGCVTRSDQAVMAGTGDDYIVLFCHFCSSPQSKKRGMGAAVPRQSRRKIAPLDVFVGGHLLLSVR